MSDGPVQVRGFLRSADTAATLDAVRALGAEVEERVRGEAVADVSIRGLGLRGVAGGREAIDVRNAGTLLRLLPGWLAGQGSGHWELDGDESIRRRPVDRVVEPLRQMGARVACRDGRLPPVVVDGSSSGRDHLRAAGRERAGEVVPSHCGVACARGDNGRRVAADARPHRDHARSGRRAGGGQAIGAGGARPRLGACRRATRARSGLGSGRPVLGGFLRRRGDARPRIAREAPRGRRQSDADGDHRRHAEDGSKHRARARPG